MKIVCVEYFLGMVEHGFRNSDDGLLENLKKTIRDGAFCGVVTYDEKTLSHVCHTGIDELVTNLRKFVFPRLWLEWFD